MGEKFSNYDSDIHSMLIRLFMATVSTLSTTFSVYFFQNMNTSGFRACVKELYGTTYDPLSVSYAVLTGL